MLDDSQLYAEELRCWGRLQLWKDRWQILYQIPGPDRRYNDDWYIVRSDEVPKYVQELPAAWEEICRLRQTVPPNGLLEKTTSLGIHLVISPSSSGLFLKRTKSGFRSNCLASRFEVDRVVKSYLDVLERLPGLQSRFWPDKYPPVPQVPNLGDAGQAADDLSTLSPFYRFLLRIWPKI